MVEHNATEIAYKNGYDTAIKEIEALKAENAELKARLEKAEAKLFITVRNNIAGEAVGDTDLFALMIIRNFDEMIDFEKAIKSKAEAEARLKELKGEKE